MIIKALAGGGISLDGGGGEEVGGGEEAGGGEEIGDEEFPVVVPFVELAIEELEDNELLLVL